MKNFKKEIIFLAIIAFITIIVLDFTNAARKQDYDDEYTSNSATEYEQDKPGIERALKIFTWEKDKNESLTYVEMKINKPVNTGPKLINDKSELGYKFFSAPDAWGYDIYITAQFEGNIEIKDNIDSEDPVAHQIFSGKIKNYNSKDESKKQYYLDSDIMRVTMLNGSNSVTTAWFHSITNDGTDRKVFYMEDNQGYIDESGENIYEMTYRFTDEYYLYITAYDPLYDDVIRASATVKLTYFSPYYDYDIYPIGDPLGVGNIHQSWTAEIVEYSETPSAYW